MFSPAEVDKLAQEAQNVASSRLAALAEALQSSDEQVRRQAEHTKTLTVDDDDDGRSNNERGGRRLQFVAPRKLESPCQDPRCPSFRRVINDRRLVERVAAILGQQSVMPAAASAVASGDNDEKLLLLLEQCFMKPPVVGSAKPFHQDNYFFEISPTDAVVTAWIALDDAVVGNGCLEYLSGSHLHGIQPHQGVANDDRDAADDDDQTNALKELAGEEWSSSKRVDSKATLKATGIPYATAMSLPNVQLECAPVPRGSIIFHHGSTIHRSGANTSNTWRRAYSTHWAAAKCRPHYGGGDDDGGGGGGDGSMQSGWVKTTARSSVLTDSVALRQLRRAAAARGDGGGGDGGGGGGGNAGAGRRSELLTDSRDSSRL